MKIDFFVSFYVTNHINVIMLESKGILHHNTCGLFRNFGLKSRGIKFSEKKSKIWFWGKYVSKRKIKCGQGEAENLIHISVNKINKVNNMRKNVEK